MIRRYRIPTKPSIAYRVWHAMETSWWPTAIIYACVLAAVIAANWSDK
jgi:hypothetical protein